LPRTRLSFAVDYFDIEVKNEVSQLGPRNIVFGCYESVNFPNDPLCSLFTRGTAFDPYGITTITDRYINIASQKNKGIDLTALVQQNLGRWGTLTILGNGTYQLRDTILLLPSSPPTNNNGDIGDPRFVADLNTTWKPRGGWSFFYGIEFYGASSNAGKFERNHGGSLCNDAAPSPIWGVYCVSVKVPAYFYHNISVTKDFGRPEHQLELTLGIRNLMNTRPPQVSVIGGSGLPSEIGPVVGTSQYDFLGRRVFFNISKKF
jgi:iron complex outermembrane receptor protein